MAKAASADSVQRTTATPDARFAVQQIRFGIKKRKDKISGINGEIADDWKKIEGKGINKIGARVWAILDGLSYEERVDAIRSLNAMSDVSEWDKQAEDLADMAEGTVVPMRMQVPGEPPQDADQQLDEIERGDAVGDEIEDEFDRIGKEIEDKAAAEPAKVENKGKPTSLGEGARILSINAAETRKNNLKKDLN
jgi:hypothetical protein